MIAANELCEKFHEPLEEHGGYIWGASGQKWTQAKQNAATRPQTVSYGQQWVGHRVWDCSGMFVWAYLQLGEYHIDEKTKKKVANIYHGSNTIWNKYCSKQGKLQNGQRCDGIAMKPGTAVFLLNDTGRHHIGLYVGNDTCIEAKGTKWGVVTSKPSHWDEWGELKDVDYSMYPDEEIPVSKPTLRKGDRGDEVKELQQMLTDAGYGNLVGKIDCAFGSKTEAAVKAFQKDNGLTVDGVVGPKTWDALEEAVGGVEPDDDWPEEPDEPEEDEPEEEEPEEEEPDDEGDELLIDRETLTVWRDALLDVAQEITDRLGEK